MAATAGEEMLEGLTDVGGDTGAATGWRRGSGCGVEDYWRRGIGVEGECRLLDQI